MIILSLTVLGRTQKANARRIVACVNACKGLSTDDLEKNGLVGAVGNQLIESDKERDQLRMDSITSVGETQVALEQRDQLRELCGEMLGALKYHRELTRPIHQSDEIITKAEKALGGNDGTAN